MRVQDLILSEAVTSSEGAKSVKKYKCPYCDNRYERQKLAPHIQRQHEDLIPEGYTALRVAFNTINKKTEGHCIMCGGVTDWNEDKGRYERLCNDPACKEAYKKMCAERNRKVYGTDRLQTDPKYADEVQRKALAGRKIAGKYKFADGGEVQYLGTYEKKFLEFMDKVMNAKSEDIQAPGPAVNYKIDGEKHRYLPDFYYIPYNLLIEIKDGGSNPNKHPHKEDDMRKTLAKEAAIKAARKYSYVRVTDNNFAQVMQIMAVLKYRLYEGKKWPILRINEGYQIEDDRLSLITEDFSITPSTTNERLYPVYIVCIGADNPLAKAIKMVTHSNFSHSGISLETSMDKIYTFNGRKNDTGGRGFRLESFDMYLDECGGNYRININVFFAKESLYKNLKKRLEYYVNRQANSKYDFLRLFGILFGKSVNINNDLSLVCSEFVALVLDFLGIKLGNGKDISLITPSDLVDAYKYNDRIYNLYTGDYKHFDSNKIKRKMLNIRKIATAIIEAAGYYSEDMSGTLNAALPLTPNPIPSYADKDNYYLIQHPKKNTFDYSITKDPCQYTLYSVDPEDKNFYKVYKTDKSKINDKYLTFKIKNSGVAKELYNELATCAESGLKISDSETYSDYIYRRLTGGNKILTEDQILFDNRFELVNNWEAQLREDCEKLYKYLKADPIDILEEQVNSIDSRNEEDLKTYNVLHDDISDINSLMIWKDKFFSMTPYQRKMSNDLSIELYGNNNLERFNKKYGELAGSMDPKKDNPYETPIQVAIESASEDNIINRNEWENRINKVKQAESQGLVIMVDPDNGFSEDYTEESIARIKEKWDLLQSLPENKRILSNQVASSIFGVDNNILYERILSKYLSRLDKESKESDSLYPEEEDPNDHLEYATTSVPYFTPEDNINSEGINNKIITKESFIGWNPEIPFDESMANNLWTRYLVDDSKMEIIDVRNILESEDAVKPIKHTSEELKDKIVPIFVCLVSGTKLISKGIKWWTDSKWSHVSLGLESSLKVLYSYGNRSVVPIKTGFVIEGKDKYLKDNQDTVIKLFALFVAKEQKKEIEDAIQWYIDNADKTRYNFGAIFDFVTRRDKASKDKEKKICSQFVYSILSMVNFKLKYTKDSRKISPADINNLASDERFYNVYEGRVKDYNFKKIDDICYKLLPSLPLEMYGIDESYTEKNNYSNNIDKVFEIAKYIKKK